MSLREHSLCQHLKLAEGLHDPDHIQLIVKLVFCLFEQVVLLEVSLSAAMVGVP